MDENEGLSVLRAKQLHELDWWIVGEYNPGPPESTALEDLQIAFNAIRNGVIDSLLPLQHVWCPGPPGMPVKTEYLLAAESVRGIRQPTPRHVGPRTKNQFDKKGRRNF